MAGTDDGGEAPCFAHQVVGGHVVDPETARDVLRFRKSERVRLYALRRAMSVADHRAASDAIAAGLSDTLADVSGRAIAVYWPIRGEPDLRGWMARAHAAGARVLLPRVVAKDAPLKFLPWSPGCSMRRGAWNIPEPDTDAEKTPEFVISPLLGWDGGGYRLGNGGGFYDRTLAGMSPAPLVIGVGFAEAEVASIFPMPWDVPMDRLVLSDRRIVEPRSP